MFKYHIIFMFICYNCFSNCFIQLFTVVKYLLCVTLFVTTSLVNIQFKGHIGENNLFTSVRVCLTVKWLIFAHFLFCSFFI